MKAYHGTRAVDVVLRDGLLPLCRHGACAHVCLALTPTVALNFGVVLEVDTEGLPVVWEKGEGRIHEPIPPDRIQIWGADAEPSWDGWEDPCLRLNHKACR